MPCVIIKRIIPRVNLLAVLYAVFILDFEESKDESAVGFVKLRIRLRCGIFGSLCIRLCRSLFGRRGRAVVDILARCRAGREHHANNKHDAGKQITLFHNYSSSKLNE